MTVEDVPLDVRITPNFPAALGTDLVSNYNRVGSFWANVAKPDRPVIIRMGTELDLDWWKAQIGQWPEMYEAIARGYSQAGAYSNSAGSYFDGTQFHHQYTFGTRIPAEAQRHAKAVTVPHEYTHSVQAASAGQLVQLPCWFVEGHANAYGIAIGAPDARGYETERRITLVRELPMSGAWPAPGPESLAQALRDSEGRQGFQCPRSTYSLGMMAVEALIAVYGHAAVNDFMRASRSQTWQTAFRSTFGLDTNAFYDAVAPYMLSSGWLAVT